MIQQLPLVDVVRELTQSTSHAEIYEHDANGTAIHVTPRPSLIAQLRTAMLTSSTAESGARAGYGSKPSARLDALDALLRIEQGSVVWMHRLTGRPVDVDLSTERLVRRLAAAGRDHGEVERDIRAWWLHGRIVTGWQTPPARPNNTCPTCRKRGGLRVRVNEDERIALCVECKSTWDETTIGHLAVHIRAENHDAPAATVGA
jgi:hypothetical protein